jgi:hypothetical protein
LPNQTGIYHPEIGRWGCANGPVVCPAGTTLYVAPPSPFSWRFCTPDVGYAEAMFGPNAAALGPVAVPALSSWALMSVFVLLAVLGAWKVR